jgi:uncharacterized protein (DUF58 family)
VETSSPTSIYRQQPSGRRLHYGLDPRQLEPRLPPWTGLHDAAYYRWTNQTGLVKVWNFFVQRMTAGGRWFALATLAFFLLASGSILETQVYVPLCYAAGLWLWALAAMWWFRPRAVIKTRYAERVCVGETLPIEIEVENRGRRAALDWRVLPHRLPPPIQVVSPLGAAVPELRAGEKTRVTLGLQATRRGVYTLRGFRVETSFPFGVLNASQRHEEARPLLVYPRFTPLQRLSIPTGRRHHPGGVTLAATRGDSFEFWGNREWRQGDTLRDIDWRATARLRRPLEKPIVREYREEFLLRVAVVLDTQVAPGNREENANFERAVSLCASCGDFMARQDYLVDIFAAGPTLYHLAAGRSLAYLDQILDILACVEPTQQTPFEQLEPEIKEHLSQITTVICVFLDWTMQRRAFVQHLVEQGAAVKVIIARNGRCTFDPLADADVLGAVPVINAETFERGVDEL